MRCSNCGSENPGDKKFCGDCGAPLANRCQQCGAENLPGKRFCSDCGAPLAANAPASRAKTLAATLTETEIRVVPEQADAPTLAEGERKAVTALFADIKGSIEVMEDLDPEDLRRVIDPALKLMMDAVNRYGGYIVQSTGDGIFALFGAPIAHEDHPQRALLAGLRMQQEIKKLAGHLRAEGRAPIQIRIGLNTGEVVVRPIETGQRHVEYTPIGHTANLASRMQTLAEPGSMVVSEATYRLSEGYFAFRSLGPARVKGVSEPVNVYEVTGIGPLRTRLQRAAGRGLTKFVGREREMDATRRALELAKQGRGQIVAAIGEAGLGKSRLFYEFKATSQSECLVLETFSVSHGKASSYLPLIELLNNYFEIEAENDTRKRREKITGKVLTLDRTLEEALPYLFALLGVEETLGALAQTDAQMRRRRTREVIKRILLRESLNQPLIVIFEDLHWIDAETQALLDLMADAIANARVLLLVNYRPEYRHGWGSKTYYAQFRLDPLGQESGEELLNALLGDDSSLRALRGLIIERTNGNPFFMEETVQVLIDEGVLVRNGAVKLTKPLSELHIPPTVQVILASRIDRLPTEEKDLLQTLAVMGKEFPLGLIKKVTGKLDDELERMLGALQDGEFIYEQPSLPDVEYSFKHSLTLEVAYNSVLSERRQVLHERTGAAIESLYAERLDDLLSDLVHHYQRAGNAHKTIDYLGRTGSHAVARGVVVEAEDHYRRALKLLGELPQAVERDRVELALQIALGNVLWSSRSWSHPETRRAYTRALELAEKLGETNQLVKVLMGLKSAAHGSGQFEQARKLAEQMLEAAEHSGDRGALCVAHTRLGEALIWRGQYAEAQRHLTLGSSYYDGGDRSELGLMGIDAPALAAIVALLLGFPDRARQLMKEAMRRAERRDDPFWVGIVRMWGGMFCGILRDGEGALAHAQELHRLATKHPVFAGLADAYTGKALMFQGRWEEGVDYVRKGAAFHRTVGLVSQLMWSRLDEVEFFVNQRQVDDGLVLITEALADSEELTQIRSAALRQRADLLALSKGEVSAAETTYRAAIECARDQGARYYELQTAMSFARWLKSQERAAEAQTLLTEIYGWFTEGFDTADLKDAKAQLDELSA
jgi:class 3 adenylate cyclase